MPENEKDNWVLSIQTIKGGIKTECVLVPLSEYEKLKKLLSMRDPWKEINEITQDLHQEIFYLDQANMKELRDWFKKTLIERAKNHYPKQFRRHALVNEIKTRMWLTPHAAFSELVDEHIFIENRGWVRLA